MKEKEELIKTTIKGREVTYYLTTEEDLNEIKSKSIIGDIFVLLFSISVGGIISIVLAKTTTTLPPESVKILDVLFYVFVIASVITGVIAAYFYRESFRLINRIKGSGEIKSLKTTEKEDITGLEILSALYWTNIKSRDVTEIFRSRVSNNKLSIIANNDLDPDPNFDPHPGTPKKLTLLYQYNGKLFQREYNEGDKIDLP